jgi:hypothetical protein
MPTPQEVFDQLRVIRWRTKDWQCAPRLTGLPAHAEEFFGKIRYRAETMVPPASSLVRGLFPVQFELVDDGTLNAFADVVDKKGYFVLNRGSVFLPLDAF